MYEVSYVKKNAFPDSRVPKDGERVLSGNDVPSEITIREMLSGVKDADGNSYVQLAGEHALIANRQSLVKAQTMESIGKGKEEIWKETGWVKGRDGKWRFEMKKELELIDAWANWEKGAAKEYRGTPWEREFRNREQRIIDAEAAGDHETADRLKRQWRQERFARVFELYLREGK